MSIEPGSSLRSRLARLRAVLVLRWSSVSMWSVAMLATSSSLGRPARFPRRATSAMTARRNSCWRPMRPKSESMWRARTKARALTPFIFWQPGVHVQVGVAVVQPVAAAVAEGDPAEGVDHVEEPGEVDLDVVVDGQPGGLGDRLDEQVGAAEGEGGVDLVRPAVDAGPQVPRERDHHRLVPRRADVQDDDGVGALAGHLDGLDPAELAAAGVRPATGRWPLPTSRSA